MRIKLSKPFRQLPEGEEILRIYDSKYDDEFGRIDVSLINADGIIHVEKYQIMDGEETNEKALNAFSYLARAALNDFDVDDIEPESIIDKYISCTVTHDTFPSNKDPKKTVTFVHLNEKKHAEGFDREPVAAALKMKASKYNIDDVLDS